MERQAKDGTFYKQVGEDEWQEVTRTAKDGTVYKKVGADQWTPKKFDVNAYSSENIEATKKQSAENAKSLGSKIMDDVVDPVMTALDYPQAPLRQVLAAPAKAARGDIMGAVLDPILQFGKSPKEAPTTAQVLEMYGVPKEKKVSPIAVSNPLGASTYEMNPLEDDSENETIYPSAQGAALLDTAVGGEGINLVTKGVSKLGKGISTGAKKLAEVTSPARAKVNAEEIIKAAKELNVPLTPAMLDNTKFIERLEFSLANSPSVWGQSIARKQEAVKEALQKTVSELTKEASTLSKNEIGEQFKSGLTAKVGERLDPIKETFDEVAKNTKASGIAPKSKEAIIRNIMKLDDYRLTEGAGRPQQYVAMLGRAENANDVKKIISYINDDLKTVSGPEKFTLIQMKDKLLNLEKNTVTRAAVQTARDLGMKSKTGEKIGTEIISDLKVARKGYRELSQDLKEASESARIKSGGPMETLDKIESIPSENIQAKFFNVNNNRQLKSLSEKFPEQFELLRQGKLRDIADSAVDFSQKGKGETSSAKFLKEVRNLTPEAKKALFGNNTKAIEHLQKIQNALPDNFNPSGTATQQKWYQVWKENITDIPNYVLYRSATSNLGKKVSEGAGRALNNMSDLPELSENAKMIPRLTGQANSNLQQIGETSKTLRVASENSPKGQDKWAENGGKKLIESGIPAEVIEQLKKDKKGKMLLIDASAVKPNSKPMNNIINKIRTGYLNKGDE